MTTNAETALSYAVSLALSGASGGGLRRTPDQIIEEAEKYRDFLDDSEGDSVAGNVWILTSPTYTEGAALDGVVGVFATREAAEHFRDHAIPPVTDGAIAEWAVEDFADGSDGENPATEEGQ